MIKNYESLGKHIQLVDIRNKCMESERLLGINIDKYFMPSVANVIGTDLSKYKLISKGQFACNPMHVGRDERLPVALYDGDTKAIVSPAYFMFEVINEQQLLPEYLMMWFKRAEFDRTCWLKTDGSVRGGISWDDICRLELPVPSLDQQKAVVKAYKAIDDRIILKRRINDNLEATAYAYFTSLTYIVEKNSVLSDIADIVMGSSPDGENYNENGEGTVFFQGRSDFGFRFPTRRLFTTAVTRLAQTGDVLMSVRAPVGDVNIALEPCCIGRGLAAIRSKNSFQSFIYYTMLELKFELSKFNDEGTVFGAINKDDLHSLPVVRLTDDEVAVFERNAGAIDSEIASNEREITRLQDLQLLLMSKLAD